MCTVLLDVGVSIFKCTERSTDIAKNEQFKENVLTYLSILYNQKISKTNYRFTGDSTIKYINMYGCFVLLYTCSPFSSSRRRYTNL